MPPTIQIVQNLAEELAGGRIGKNWTISQFTKRHSKRILTVCLRPIDKSRVPTESVYIFEQFYCITQISCMGLHCAVCGLSGVALDDVCIVAETHYSGVWNVNI